MLFPAGAGTIWTRRTWQRRRNPQVPPRPSSDSFRRSEEVIFDIFRRWGYLQSTLDPLGQFLPGEPFPTPAPDGELSTEARGFYCGTMARSSCTSPDPERRQWIQERMEAGPAKLDQAQVLTQLIRADLFEQVIQSRYLGRSGFRWKG